MIDRYGHEDDAIERFQARMQRALYASIAQPWALRVLEQIEQGAKRGNETDRGRD